MTDVSKMMQRKLILGAPQVLWNTLSLKKVPCRVAVLQATVRRNGWQLNSICIHSVWIRYIPSLQWRHNKINGTSNHRRLDFFSTVSSGADQRKHQSFASLAFVKGIHQWPLTRPVTRKMFPFDDVIMPWVLYTALFCLVLLSGETDLPVNLRVASLITLVFDTKTTIASTANRIICQVYIIFYIIYDNHPEKVDWYYVINNKPPSCINSLRPCDTYMRQYIMARLVQVMVYGTKPVSKPMRYPNRTLNRIFFYKFPWKENKHL